MAEIDHIPGEHIQQGGIPQKRVGQYSFLIRSYAIYKGQGKTLDGTSCVDDRNDIVQAAEEKRSKLPCWYGGNNDYLIQLFFYDG